MISYKLFNNNDKINIYKISTSIVRINYISNLSANCSDGVQNQKEEGVDCGGTCPACGRYTKNHFICVVWTLQ